MAQRKRRTGGRLTPKGTKPGHLHETHRLDHADPKSMHGTSVADASSRYTPPVARDVKVSPLLVLAKACLLAIRRTPEINSTWDEAAQEVVLKHYVNLGIAAATPRGLVVPNVKDADAMTLRELAEALGELTTTAKETEPIR